jgi:hypothetical protein
MKIVVVIPCYGILKEQQDKVKKIYEVRAGIECTIYMIEDTNKEGWVSIHNRMSKELEWDWYVYSAQDYYPGRQYLKIALESAIKHNKKHIAFNDGKWFGENATAGLVHKDLIQKIPYKTLFYRGYFMHGADPELTAITKKLNEFHYEPLALCVEVDYNKDIEGSKRYPEDSKLYRLRAETNFTTS